MIQARDPGTSSHRKLTHILLFWFGDDWGVFGRTYEQIATTLSRLDHVRQVLVVLPSSKGECLANSRQTASDKLAVVRLYWRLGGITPFRLRSLGSRMKLERERIALKRLIKAYGFSKSNTLLWLFPAHPIVDELVRQVPAAARIMQVVDDFTLVDKDDWYYPFAIDQYPRLGGLSDLIAVTSRVNEEKFSLQSRCVRIDQAVSSSFLAEASDFRPCGPQPVLGYVGTFWDRTDIDLLLRLALERRHCKLLLVGPELNRRLSDSGLLGLDNVEWLGSIPNDQVPSQLKRMNLCLIPHLDTPFSRSMSPLKLFQYIASGKPVVSSAVEGLDLASHLIRIESDPERFLQAIDEELASDGPDKFKARVAFARAQTWESRVDRILAALDVAMGWKSA
ncbi:glycosyltransferase [Synechococcus sp. CS-1332]|uniref:glycosyltransferase n=1 Tax=Synechococcus sp. CS-1332 TaxID=2847972 RepID=UPI00223BC8B2|nr:glycosyltransferase [Synechococcus sp. CS-1332]MCT0208447.1 glycosyltransferase [Synechococcus sp. CS-1332]